MDIKDKLLLGLSATTFVTSAYFFQQPDYSIDNINRGNAIGRLETISNTVKQKPKGTLAWLDADGGQNLYFDDQIFTHEESHAKITLGEDITLNLSPNTLIKLGKDLGSLDLDLSQGFFSVDVKKTQSKKFNISLGGKQISINSEGAKLQVQNTGQTSQLYLKDGTAKVSSGNTLTEIEAGTTVIPKGAVISAKIEAVLAEFPYQNRSELETLFKLNSNISSDDLRKMMLKGVKVKSLITLYQLKPSADFPTLVRISRFERIKNITPTIRKFPALSLPKLYELLSADRELNIGHINKALSAKKDLNLAQIKKIDNARISQQLRTFSLRPNIQYSEIPNTLAKLPQYSLTEVNELLSNNSTLKLSDLRVIKEKYDNVTKEQLKTLSGSSQVSQIPTIAKAVPLESLVAILKANPTADIVQASNYSRSNSRFKLSKLPETMQVAPNSSLSDINSLLLSNKYLTHSDINQMLTSNPTFPVNDLSSTFSQLSKSQTSGLVVFLKENPVVNIQALNGSIKTNPGIKLSTSKEREKLLAIVNSSTKNKSFSKEKLAQLKASNPKLSEQILLGFLAVSPNIKPSGLKTYSSAFPSIDDLKQLKSLLASSPDVNLHELTTLKKNHPKVDDELLQKIYQQNPKITPKQLDSILKSRPDINSEQLISNLAGINNTASATTILLTDKSSDLGILQKLIQRNPTISLKAISSMLEADDKARLTGFLPIAKQNFDSYRDVQKKYPTIRTTHIQNILTNRPRTTAKDLQLIMAAAPKTNGEHLETILTVGKKIDAKDFAQLLKTKKEYGVKEYIPLFAIRPEASASDVVFAFKNDPKLQLKSMISALQTNSKLHPRYVNSAQVAKASSNADLLIVKQNVRPQANQDIFRLDGDEKVKLGWNNAAKSSNSSVIIAEDPQFSSIIKKVDVTTKTARPISDIEEKIEKIQKIVKEEDLDSNIKLSDIPSIIAINPNLDEDKLIKLMKENPKISGTMLRSMMAIKPSLNLSDLSKAFKDNRDLNSTHVRAMLSIDPHIDVKDIGDTLSVREDISPSRLVRSTSNKSNFKDVKDILVNFPKVTPEELNQITSTNKVVTLKPLFSLLKIQDKIRPHSVHNTTKKYSTVNPEAIKNITQKRPDTRIQSIDAIMEMRPSKTLDDIQQLLSTDATMSPNQAASILKVRPNFDFKKMNDLLIKHPHIQAQEITPLLVENSRISIDELDTTFSQNSALTPGDLNAILSQNPELKARDVSNLIKANPSVDIKHIPTLFSANPGIDVDDLTNLLKKNPELRIAEITPLIVTKKDLDLDDLSSTLRNRKDVTIADIQRHLLDSPNKSLKSVQTGVTNQKSIQDQINRVIVEYPQINRVELETIIKSNPRFNIAQYKSLLEENIPSSELHQILISSPKSDLGTLRRLDKKFSLSEVQSLVSVHPDIPLNRLESLPKETSLDDLNYALTRRPNLSLQDLASLVNASNDSSPGEILQVVSQHKGISIIELQAYLKTNPDAKIKLINQIYEQNPRFSLKKLSALSRKNSKIDRDGLLELVAENPSIDLIQLGSFFKQSRKIGTRQLRRIYKLRQHLTLQSLGELLALPPKLSASEIHDILQKNTHVQVEDLTTLLKANRRLTKNDLRELAPAIEFTQVVNTISSAPLPIVKSAIRANPNVDMRKLKSFSSSHPYITEQDLNKTLSIAPNVDLNMVSRFLTNNPRYKIFNVNDMLAINPHIDLDALSKIHRHDPQIKKKDILTLIAVIPSVSLTRLSNTATKLPQGQFQAFSSLMQAAPTTPLESFDKLVSTRPNLNINKLANVAKSNQGITIDDIYKELNNNPSLSVDDPKLIQNILSLKQQVKLTNLPAGNYYWKVSSKVNNVNIEGPISSFRVELGSIPLPLYPKNNVEILTTNFERSVRIRWEKQEGAKYEIELTHWDEKNKVSTVQKFKSSDNFLDLQDLATRKYSWRVRVTGEKRLNAHWSSANSFVIKNRPFFIPIYPTAKDKIVVNNSFPAVKFKWKGIPDTPYVITIATDRNFRKIVMKETVKGTSFTWDKPIPGKLYWKLALTSNDLQSPHIQSMEVYCSPITLLTPLKNQTFILFKKEQQVKLEWKNLTPSFLKRKRDFEYFIELAADPEFKKILTTRETKEESVTLKFSYPKRYYWRIQIKDPTKYETPSFSTPFEIKLSPPPAPPVLKKNYIREIKDSGSANFFKRLPYRTIASEDSDFNTTYVDIGWYKVDYVKGYIIEIYKDIDLTELVHTGRTEKNEYRWMAAKAGNFYYRLASYDHWNRQSPFTPAETMTITVPRSVPQLNDPKPDAVRIINRGSGMKFSWYKVKYSSKYIWEISKDPEFNNILLRKENYGSNEFEVTVPKNRITQIGFHYWRVHSHFPIGDPTLSDPRRVSLENVMEFDHDVWITGFGYTNMITETAQQDAGYFSSESNVNKGFQVGGSIEYMLTGKKLEYGRYKKKFQLHSELSFRTILNHIYPLSPLEFSLKEKLITNKFNLWGYSPSIIAAVESGSHLSTRETGALQVQSTLAILAGLGVHKEYYVNERKLDAYFELLTPLYFSTSIDLYAIPISSLKLNLRARYNIWGPFDAGADLSYAFYNNVIDKPFTHSDFYFAGSLTLKLF